MSDRELHSIAFYLTSQVAARRSGRARGLLEISWPPGCVLVNGTRCTTLAEVRKAVGP